MPIHRRSILPVFVPQRKVRVVPRTHRLGRPFIPVAQPHACFHPPLEKHELELSILLGPSDQIRALRNESISCRVFVVLSCEEDGPTAVEYAVMLALIVVVCLAAIKTVGTNAKTTFTNVAGSLSGS